MIMMDTLRMMDLIMDICGYVMSADIDRYWMMHAKYYRYLSQYQKTVSDTGKEIQNFFKDI